MVYGASFAKKVVRPGYFGKPYDQAFYGLAITKGVLGEGADISFGPRIRNFATGQTARLPMIGNAELIMGNDGSYGPHSRVKGTWTLKGVVGSEMSLQEFYQKLTELAESETILAYPVRGSQWTYLRFHTLQDPKQTQKLHHRYGSRPTIESAIAKAWKRVS
jgi:hypothetical protein